MNVHWLQHAEHEDTGCIEPWLRRHGHRVARTRLYAGERLPAAVDFDWLIVMGGPMNIYEHDRHPWLVPEKALIRAAIQAGRKVLGICLGSQLIADVLGGPVTRNRYSEVGWFPVRFAAGADKAPLFADFPDEFPAFHWHGDTYALPPGARGLMSSEACAQQGFVWDGRVVGLQFHLEVTAANARAWFGVEQPQPDRYVQMPADILADDARFAENNRLMACLLRRMAELP